MSSVRQWVRLVSLILVFVVGAFGQADAAQLDFVPPNDPTGAVFTTNTNDGYSSGRGVVFHMDAGRTLEGIGIYHDFTSIDLFWEVAEVLVTTGDVTTGQTILRSGNAVTTTTGLEWIEFSFAALPLVAGSNYHIEFTHTGNGNQNFFYWNQNVTFTADAFSEIDGTAGGNTSNTVMPAIRVIGPDVPVELMSFTLE